MARTLTPKQAAYRDARVSGLGPADAYRTAYDASRMSPAAIYANAHKLEKNTSIALGIAQGAVAVAERAIVSAADVTEALSHMAFVDIGDLVQWDDEGRVQFTPSRNLSKTQRAAVKKVTHVRRTIPQKGAEPIIEETVALELESKKGALDSLARILGMFRDTIDINLIHRLGQEWGLSDAEMESAVREAEAIAKGKVGA